MLGGLCVFMIDDSLCDFRHDFYSIKELSFCQTKFEFARNFFLNLVQSREIKNPQPSGQDVLRVKGFDSLRRKHRTTDGELRSSPKKLPKGSYES